MVTKVLSPTSILDLRGVFLYTTSYYFRLNCMKHWCVTLTYYLFTVYEMNVALLSIYCYYYYTIDYCICIAVVGVSAKDTSIVGRTKYNLSIACIMRWNAFPFLAMNLLHL